MNKIKVLCCVLALVFGWFVGGKLLDKYQTDKAIACSVVIEGSKIVQVVELIVGSEGLTTKPATTVEHWVGSGVVISKKGIILTAGHCVKDANEIWVTIYNGERVKATGYYYDKKYDVGLIKIPYWYVNNCATIGNSDRLKNKVPVFTVGNSGGIWDNTITRGNVYTVHFSRFAALGVDDEFILVVMDIIAGNSGGGVYSNGNLIGIVSRGGRGATFVVPTSIIKPILRRNGI